MTNNSSKIFPRRRTGGLLGLAVLLLSTCTPHSSIAITANAAPVPEVLVAVSVNKCPDMHIFGARETTAPPGFGSSQTLVDLLQKTFPGATAEAIDYPAAGGRNYSRSVEMGIAAVLRQMDTFAARCPDTVLVMHGYSQGGQIMDDVFCGGPDGSSLNSSAPLVSRESARNVAAIILMGDPRHVPGAPFNVGNATASGFAARPKGFRCRAFENRMQLYCDEPDPFCSNGTSLETHQGYGKEYGRRALDFVISKLIL